MLLTSSTPALLKAEVVAYWRFEEGITDTPASGANSIVDSSGHSLNGTPFSGPVYRANVPSFGNVNADALSLEFNGLNQRVFVPDDPQLRLTQSLTIEAFIYARPLPPGEIGADILVRSDDRSGLDPYRLTLQFTGGLLFQVMNASGQFAGITANVSFNEWHHVAGTLDDATGIMNLYIDGNLANSTTTTTLCSFGAEPESWLRHRGPKFGQPRFWPGVL